MRSIGVIVLSFFAAVWWAWGVSNTPHVSALLIAAGIIMSIVLVILALRADRGATPPTQADQRRISRIVGCASAAEGVAILLAVNVLNWLSLSEYFICAVAIIVGLHFIPLARMPHARVYNLTAAALVMVGLAGALLPWPLRGAVVGTAAAMTIWATCAAIIATPRHPNAALALGAA